MKTQILTLDAHDDYISARDKISWTQAGRIILVWPEHGQVLNRYLDLVLLSRHTSRLGAQLALVTRDNQVQHHARQLNIPVFNNLAVAQRSKWRPGQRLRSRIHLHPNTQNRPALNFEKLHAETHFQRPEWTQLLLFRSIVFTLGVLAILALALFLLPEARIIIYPHTQVQAVNLTVNASPNIKSVNIAGNLPAQYRTIIVEGRAVLPVSGSTRVAQNYATGNILLTNLNDQSLAITEGMVVRTGDADPVRFIITESGEVPAGVGETASFPIRALHPGSAGNMPAGKLNVIEGAIGINLVAINQVPTNGGSDITVPAPSAADQDRLYEILEKTLLESALDQLQAQSSDGDLIIKNGLEPTQVIEKTFDPPAVLPAEEIRLLLRLEFQAPVIISQDLRTLADAVLDANLEVGYYPVENTLEISHLSTPQVHKDNLITWKLNAERSLEAHVSEAQLISLVIGLPLEYARERLAAALPIDGQPQISITPEWWSRLPYLPFRIHIGSNE